jgi:hypothetical protein
MAFERIKSLPIRSPPSSKANVFFARACSPTPQMVPALLTPVESSDDDIASNDLNFEPSPLPQLNDPNTRSDSTTCSAKVAIGDDGDMEMADSQPREFSLPRPWQRQRSNDMLAPPNLPYLLDTQRRPGPERLPTPIYGHFIDSDVNMDMSGASARSTTLLSPLIREEDEPYWWRDHCLPSPVDAFAEIMTPVSQAGGMMSRLDVNTAGSNDLSRNKIPFPAFSNQEHSAFDDQRERLGGESSAPQSRRLTMGFRADCEKCIRRVPGHYSHIVYE